MFKKISGDVQHREEVRLRIMQACENIEPAMIQRATRGINHRLELCLQQNGWHFEQF